VIAAGFSASPGVLVSGVQPGLAAAAAGLQPGKRILIFTALISINLAVVEGLRGKPLPERFQMAFMQSGFVFLVGLSVVLIVKYTSQLPVVQQLLGR
jgi:membrane-associated protease RseP (regulator of RpoE activity)